jgi:hypothetical protein
MEGRHTYYNGVCSPQRIRGGAEKGEGGGGGKREDLAREEKAEETIRSSGRARKSKAVAASIVSGAWAPLWRPRRE